MNILPVRRLPFFGSILIYSLLICLISGGCKAHRKNTKMPDDSYTASFPVSASAGALLDKLQTAFPEGYSPDKDTALVYSIQSQGLARDAQGNYFVSGFIKTGDGFERTPLADKGIVLSPGNGPVYTVRIPLEQFSFFLHQPGIAYFDLSRKVFPR